MKVYKILIGQFVAKSSFGRPRGGCNDNINIGLMNIGCEDKIVWK
jgi:hypothetical protein